MRALWLLIKCLMAIAIAAIGAMFALRNDQMLGIDFILLRSPEISLGLWLLIFLVAGSFLGLLASSFILGSYRRKLAQLKKEMKKNEPS